MKEAGTNLQLLRPFSVLLLGLRLYPGFLPLEICQGTSKSLKELEEGYSSARGDRIGVTVEGAFLYLAIESEAELIGHKESDLSEDESVASTECDFPAHLD